METIISEYKAGRSGKVELYIDAAGEHRWRIIRGGRNVANSGEGYTSAAKARQALRGLKKLAAAIEV